MSGGGLNVTVSVDRVMILRSTSPLGLWPLYIAIIKEITWKVYIKRNFNKNNSVIHIQALDFKTGDWECHCYIAILILNLICNGVKVGCDYAMKYVVKENDCISISRTNKIRFKISSKDKVRCIVTNLATN